MEWVEVRGARGGSERLALRFDAPEPNSGAEPPTPELCVLYLHGFGSSQAGEKAELFRARAIARRWAFCSFDLRGHGASGGSMRDLTLTRCLQDVAAVRAVLSRRGCERVALFGSSMGGAVGLWHAIREPEGLVAAAHLAPAVGMARAMETWAGADRLARWQADGEILFESELVSTVLGWELIEDLRRFDLADLVRDYRTPTIVFQGRLDQTVDWRDVASFVEGVERERPGTIDFRLFEDGDHRLLDRKELLWSLAEEAFARALPAD